MTHIAQLFKIFFFNKNSQKIVNLVYSLEGEIFAPRNERQSKILEKAVRAIDLDFKFYSWLTISTCFLYSTFPFFDNIGQERHLPFLVWYPFNIEISPIFEIVYLYQIFSVTNNALHNVVTDTMFSGLMKMAGAQLSMLQDTMTYLTNDVSNNQANF